MKTVANRTSVIWGNYTVPHVVILKRSEITCFAGDVGNEGTIIRSAHRSKTGERRHNDELISVK